MQSQHSPEEPDDQRLTLQASQQLVHELQVHQTQLEAQNEELRHVKLALEASKAELVGLYDLAPVGYCSVSANGLITRVNQTLATLLGVMRKDLTHQHLSRFIFRDDQDSCYLLRQSQRRSPPESQPIWPATCELRMVKADGSTFWALLSAAQGPDLGWLFTLTDISAAKRLEAQLQFTKDRLQVTLDAIPDLIFEVNAQGQILSYHARRSHLLAASPQVFMGRAIADVLPVEATAVCMRALREAASTGWASGSIYSLPLAQGETWFELSVTTMPGSDAGEQRFVVVARDITERTRQEHERRNLADRVKSLSRALVQAQEHTRKRFSQELHDRTSPNLAALRINLDMIANTTPASQVSQALADRIQDTRALIEDTTLSIREICAGLHPTALERVGLLGTVQSYALQLAQRTGLQVPVDCKHGEIRLDADLELALFRIVQEALTNCAKHAQATQVQVVVQLDTNPMRISVSDDGVGFPPRFAQNGTLHTGMGLVNMRETAEFAGASFTLMTAPGQGTRIVLEMA